MKGIATWMGAIAPASCRVRASEKPVARRSWAFPQDVRVRASEYPRKLMAMDALTRLCPCGARLCPCRRADGLVPLRPRAIGERSNVMNIIIEFRTISVLPNF